MNKYFGALGLAGLLALPFGCDGQQDAGPPGGRSSCPAGQQKCSGACVDVGSNPNNCGSCGSSCSTGQSCASGACQCQAPLAACGAACVDKSSHPQNCGNCGVACAAGQVCSAGVCAATCGAGLTQCGASCVDLSSAVQTCGSCTTACAAGQACAGGVCGCPAGQLACAAGCTNPLTDGSNCGSCGNVCAAGVACVGGVCQSGAGGAGGQGNGGAGGSTSGAGGQSAGGSGGQNGGAGGANGGTGNGGAGGATGGAGAGGQGAGGAGAGGQSGSGGSGGSTTGPCSRPIGSCSSPTVTVTEVEMGFPVTTYGSEFDTLPLPMAMAAKPSGGSRIAVRGTDGNIRIGDLDCNDHLVGTPFTLPAVDLQDLHSDDNGGVVMLTRLANGSGTDHCGPNTLCGGTSSPCYNSTLVRFDNAGNEVWATAVTNLDQNLGGYQNGARFVWGNYQHHGRLAFDGSNYAAYFCIGITVNNGSCVDIHEGDRMQVVSGSGTLIANHADAFPVGCSHSWVTRMVWDPRTNHFVMVCTTDNSCRMAQPDPYRTVATGACDGQLFGGDLVLSSTPGYWLAWSQTNQIRLEHFSTGASDMTITNAGASQHPHLVSYGTSRMLLSWGSGQGMAAQVRDAGNGQTVGSQFTINVPDHNYMGWKAFPDGSAAYAAAGSTSTSIRIARVMPCN